MARLGPNAPCPCGSGRKHKRCCRRLHLGQTPDTAEALMRARYCAYAVKNADFIITTTHPDSPHARPDTDAWRDDILRFCATTTFERLDVILHEPGEPAAHVTFTAHLQQAGQPTPMTERSRFIRHDGRWCYLAAAEP